MNANRLIQLGCGGLIVACLLGAAALTPSIDRQRDKLELTFTPDEDNRKEMPADIAVLTTVLGPIRGPLVNVLWYRTEELKNAGKYHEANTSASLITTLQPKFGQVWLFQSWNMAYNISVGCQTPAERWEWVQKGINLLRDEGIPNNPHNVTLYQQLAWTYFHKVGKHSDDAHWYYKSKLAEEWDILLGRDHVDGTTEEIIEGFREIAEAPDTVKDLLEKNPEIQLIIDRLAEIGIAADRTLVEQMGRYDLYQLRERLPSTTDEKKKAFLLANIRVNPKFAALMLTIDDPKAAKPSKLKQLLDQLLDTLRKRAIIDEQKMDPTYMMAMMDGEVPSKYFGRDDEEEIDEVRDVIPDFEPAPMPLDWRHPAAHGAYWALLGTEKGIYRFNKKNVDQLNTYRNYIHSVQEMVYFGKIDFNPYMAEVESRIQVEPNVVFFDNYDQAYEAGLAFIKGKQFDGSGTEDSFDTGHMNLLEKAVVYSYLYGDEARAQKFYTKVALRYGNRPENRDGRYDVSLSEFVDKDLEQAFGEFSSRMQILHAMFNLAFRKGLAANNGERYNHYRTQAARVFKKIDEASFSTAVAQRARLGVGMVDEKGRKLEFAQAEANTFGSYLRDSRRGLVERSRAYVNAPNDMKLRVYDRILPYVRERCQAQGMSVAGRFPVPQGIEQWRKDHPIEIGGERDTGGAEVERK